MLDNNLIELQRVASTLRLSLEEVLTIFNILQANTLLTVRDVLDEAERDSIDPFTRLDILKNKLNGYIAKAMYEANAAVFMANEALEIAEEADVKSDTAVAKSDTAITIANSANSVAVNARSTADNALVKSNEAIGISNDAIIASNTAVNTANSASAIVNTLDTKINDVNVTATQATNKATQAANTANEALLATVDNANRITTLELEEHFKGYFATTDELNAVSAKDGDYAYNAETGTRWIYNAGAWSDSLLPVPDKTVIASDSIPLIDQNTGSVGTSTSYARGDHSHPTDISRASVTQLTNLESSVDVQLGTKASSSDLTSAVTSLTTQINTKVDQSAFSSTIGQLYNIINKVETSYAGSFNEIYPENWGDCKFYHIPDASSLIASPTTDANGGILFVGYDDTGRILQLYLPYNGDVLFKRIHFDGLWQPDWDAIGDASSIVIPNATETVAGIAKKSTISQATARTDDTTFMSPAMTRGVTFTTKVTLTTGSSWVAPKTGYIRVTVIGGGGAGGSSRRRGGGAGGYSHFNSNYAYGGSGGGGTGGDGSSSNNLNATYAGGAGGAAGQLEVYYLHVTSGTTYYYTIGAGGTISTIDNTAPSSASYSKAGANSNTMWGGGIAPQGAGHGGDAIVTHGSTATTWGGNGGNGGTCHPLYGGGGGGSGGCGSAGTSTGGRGGSSNASNGSGNSGTDATAVINGGNGGSGAIIIEY